ncbi:MAG: aldolase/citrate lyase family protein [Yoonia sp.]|uniref:HpcH/HpaI aldolase family protein n=1 Tax=Yoonia sp. TaxID=2212373 RepID=UPI00273F0930|nr:aldolase/citrate lyase family protein [Yoonia sp.]MDP5084084.1 aldolase/citrate lyase family protein [Yoonia sp.]MDP5361719.1 aldolase/citrate lyase family protein [Paracoccaceae bacterium]
MKMRANPFLAAIRAGQPQIGLWISLANNYAAEVVASAGFDWLLVDMEHAPAEVATVLGQLQAIAPHGSTAIVRPPWNDPVMVKRLLDIGAPGLLFPMVQSVAEAQAAVAATRYPPQGVRGVAGSIRANQFGRITDYYAKANDETAVILQVETRHAVAQAVEIGQVAGVDGIFFGPADIAADMGLLGQHMSEPVWDLILTAAGKLMAAGIPVGTLVTDPAFAARLLREGFTFVACGTDTNLLAKGADALRAQMRDATRKEN